MDRDNFTFQVYFLETIETWDLNLPRNGTELRVKKQLTMGHTIKEHLTVKRTP
jgi:hypothetical protein